MVTTQLYGVASTVSVYNTVSLVIFVVVIYKLISSYRRYREWEKLYDSFPGDKDKHWFWGHIHKVCLYVSSTLHSNWSQFQNHYLTKISPHLKQAILKPK